MGHGAAQRLGRIRGPGYCRPADGAALRSETTAQIESIGALRYPSAGPPRSTRRQNQRMGRKGA
jgi:hypothetical protein